MTSRNSNYLFLALLELLNGPSPKAIAKCACYGLLWYGKLTRKEFVIAMLFVVVAGMSEAHTSSLPACRECLPLIETQVDVSNLCLLNHFDELSYV